LPALAAAHPFADKGLFIAGQHPRRHLLLFVIVIGAHLFAFFIVRNSPASAPARRRALELSGPDDDSDHPRLPPFACFLEGIGIDVSVSRLALWGPRALYG
jgi:hypothetical protein